MISVHNVPICIEIHTLLITRHQTVDMCAAAILSRRRHHFCRPARRRDSV